MKEQQINELYKKWPQAKRFLKTLGCPANEAEDLFQEAILIFCQKRDEPSFQLTVEPIYYVQNTCKLLWYNLARKQQRNVHIELPNDLEAVEQDWIEKESQLNQIEAAILNIGKQCQEILTLFYGKKWSMDLIAKKIGLRSEKVVKVQKHRCIQKVKDQLAK